MGATGSVLGPRAGPSLGFTGAEYGTRGTQNISMVIDGMDRN